MSSFDFTPHDFETVLRQAVQAVDYYSRTGADAELAQAVDALERLVDHPGFGQWPLDEQLSWLQLTATTHGLYYGRYGDPQDLDRAVTLLRHIVQHAPLASPDMPVYLNNLSLALVQRFEATAQTADLQEAIGVIQRAMDIAAPDAPDRADNLSLLGVCLRHRYLRTGQVVDLDEAIRATQTALNATVSGAPERPIHLIRLANLMRDRYAHAGNVEDLEESIQACQEAVQLCPHASPESAEYLNALGLGLYARFMRLANPTDLEQSIQAHRQAVQATLPGSPLRPGFLNNLGNALQAHYDVFGHRQDLDEGIECRQQAIQSSRAGSHDVSLFHNNLGTGLRRRYELSRHRPDLEQALVSYRQALEGVTASAPNRAVYLNNLGYALVYRYNLTQAPDDLEAARSAFEQACVLGLNVAPEEALRSARNGGNWALEREAWMEAAGAFRFGYQAIDRLLGAQFLRSGKEAWLREAQALPGYAAYALAKTGDLRGAVEALEGGRTRLLDEALQQNRRDLERLAELGHGDLLEQYRHAAQQVQFLEQQGQAKAAQPSGAPAAAGASGWRQDIEAARAKLETVINAIRQVPGYHDFFSAPTFEQIQGWVTAEGSAGVYVSVTSVGGLALVIHPGGIKEIWLDVPEDEMDMWLIERQDGQVIGGYLAAQMGQAPLDAALAQVLPPLGDRVMRPMAQALKSLGASDVTLIPCGRLGLFPLHAAEYLVDGRARCFMDEFTVTYTPSARALGSCRDTLAAAPEQPRTLCGVGNPMPLPEGVRPLNYARPEVEEIAPLFGEAATLLYERQATWDALDKQLGQTAYLHLACHGIFDAQDPLQSGVVLSYGEMFTLEYLLGGRRLRGARLVVLSACQTAMMDFDHLPEEAIGLPAGFVQAGAPGIVGTLWPVNDLSTMLSMVQFYERHLQEGLAPPAALRKAQLWLRDVTNAELGELFAKYKLAAADRPSTRMAYALASDKFREHTLRDPNERPFAHPYYWAAFAFYGV